MLSGELEEENNRNGDESYSAEDEAGPSNIINTLRRKRKKKRAKKGSATVKGFKLSCGKGINIKLCIICQTSKDIAPIGTGTGRKKLLMCAEKRKDVVLERIRSTNSEESFVYHSGNVCYKPYILKIVSLLHDKDNTEDMSGNDTVMAMDEDDNRPSLRSTDSTREKPSSGKYVWEILCVICNKKSKDKIREKHRLEKDSRAEKFLEVANKKLDAVYTRVCDCTDPCRMYGADLYYHSTCMRNYIREEKTHDNPDICSPSDVQESDHIVQSNREALEKVVASLTPSFLSGTGFTLSEVRDRVNELVHPNQIHNYQVKLFLKDKLSDAVKFCPSTRKNESLMFFSATLLAEDIARKVRSIDVVKDAACILREEMKSTNFGLEDKYCDAFDLKDAWANGQIKENTETLSEEMIDKAEEYLCSVLNGKLASLKSFDDVRYFQYRSKVPIHSIVPSSTCMRNGHIMRMFLLSKRLSSLVSRCVVPLDPIMYSWKEKDGYLLPNKCLREIPKNLIKTCGCNDCSSKMCGCRRNLSKCTIYCACTGNNACRNTYNVQS